jgi:molybdopterin biosynthesis enzyme
VATLPATLALIGQSAAGHGFDGTVKAGETVRIFTGAPLPDGADAILIQEDAEADGDRIRAQAVVTQGRHVRAAGLDFKQGERLLAAGTRLGPAELALAAAMNHPTLPVARQPRVAILATGDELVRPGMAPGPDQIVASNSFAVAGMVTAAGGTPLDLGIAGDSFEALQAAIAAAKAAGADVLVTTSSSRRSPRKAWSSASGASPCGPASHCCMGGWARWRFSACPATRSPPSSAPSSSWCRCCARWPATRTRRPTAASRHSSARR